MKVSIVHGWSDDNRGDSAIMMGMIQYINDTYKIDNMNIVSYYEKCEEGSYNLLKFVKDRNINFDKIYRNIALNDKNKIIRYIKFLYDYTRKRLLLINYNMFRFMFSKEEKETIDAILNSDVVISKGGHIFNSKTYKENLSLFNLSFYLLLAKKMNKKVYIFSQSYGPFENKQAKKIFKKVLEASDEVLCREDVSVNYLNDNFKEFKDKYTYFPDFAFNIKPIFSKKVENIYEKYPIENSIVVTVRQHMYKDNTEEEYLTTLKNIIERLINNGETVIIYPHVIGPTKIEDDRIISRKLFDMINPIFRNDNKVVLLDEDLSAEEVAGLYSKIKFIIGTRFHSVILTLINARPAFAISYSGPKANIMKRFGMDKYMYNIEKINSKNEEEIIKLIDNLNDNEKNMAFKLEKKLCEEITMFNNDVIEMR